MPEGDTLHRLAGKLAPVLTGQLVRRVTLPRTTVDARGLAGSTITGVEARGKNLLVHFSASGPGGELSLHVHLAMRGRVELTAGAARPASETVAILETDTHAVVVVSAPVARLIRTRDLVRDRAFRDLGPDLLGVAFDVNEGVRRLRFRNDRPLGEVLLDQGAVAGIGNVWKSELCFLLRLDPRAPVAAHTDQELLALLDRARGLMRANVDAPRRSTPDPFAPRTGRIARDARLGEGPLSVYDRAAEPCYTCGTAIARVSQGLLTPRVTYLCPSCQTRRA